MTETKPELAPETTPNPKQMPAPPPPDPGTDLLGQVFGELSARDDILLAAKVGGGLARIAALTGKLGMANVEKEAARIRIEQLEFEVKEKAARIELLEGQAKSLVPPPAPGTPGAVIDADYPEAAAPQ